MTGETRMTEPPNSWPCCEHCTHEQAENHLEPCLQPECQT